MISINSLVYLASYLALFKKSWVMKFFYFNFVSLFFKNFMF